MRLSLPVTSMILATVATMPTTAEARSYVRFLTTPSQRDRGYHYSRRPLDTSIDIVNDIMLSPFFKFHQDANSLLRQHVSALLSSSASAPTSTPSTTGSQLRLDSDFSSQPPYTIFENANTGVIELSMDIPGVAAKDLSIELENDVLRISGSRKRTNLSGETTTESKFDQSFQLDNDVDPEGLEVTLSDGVLCVSAPKKEKIVKHLTIKAVETEEDYATALETNASSDQGIVEWSMDVPGVSAKDLSIELENGSVLRIAGSRKHKNQIGETVESKFHQSFQLNNDVEPEGLEVTLSHGVLRVLAPKKEKIVKRFAIKTAEEDDVALEANVIDQEIDVGKTPTDETPVEEVIELDEAVVRSY